MCVGGQGGLAARSSIVNKQARLLERKVCFISLPATEGGRVADICLKAGGESIYRAGWGVAATCRNSTVISQSSSTGHEWPNEHHLGCF